MKEFSARLSQFEKFYAPVDNPVEFFKTCRRKFGKPEIVRWEGTRWYHFFYSFDKVSIMIEGTGK